MSAKDRLVTVCSECLMASCWHGEFMCENSISAGTREMTARELDKLRLEHPSHYSVENLARICGRVE